MENRYVLACLGNPGARYESTRHNLGFHVADFIAGRSKTTWSFSAATFAAAHVRIKGEVVLVIKPQTFMNLSGEALQELSDRDGFQRGRLLVVCDDIVLPFGQMRLRSRGSDGGHNGLVSIIETLGTPSFCRLRLGVGPVPEGVDAADFVTAPMSEDELASSAKMVRQAVRCVETWIEHGPQVAMTRFNARPRTAEPESD